MNGIAKLIANGIDSRLHYALVSHTHHIAMIVCVCHRVSEGEIVRHAKLGFGFDDIQLELGVATQCGQCESCARDIVDQCCKSQPVAAIRNAVNFSPAKLPAH